MTIEQIKAKINELRVEIAQFGAEKESTKRVNAHLQKAANWLNTLDIELKKEQ